MLVTNGCPHTKDASPKEKWPGKENAGSQMGEMRPLGASYLVDVNTNINTGHSSMMV
jgi:hypothetical protein